MTTSRLILEAYVALVAHDLFMARRSLAELRDTIKSAPIRPMAVSDAASSRISHALDIACAFYPKQTLCLQRSAVLVRLLRRHGLRAKMIIGAQKLPFKAHAWVEIDGVIVGDRTASREKFLVLEVC